MVGNEYRYEDTCHECRFSENHTCVHKILPRTKSDKHYHKALSLTIKKVRETEQDGTYRAQHARGNIGLKEACGRTFVVQLDSKREFGERGIIQAIHILEA